MKILRWIYKVATKDWKRNTFTRDQLGMDMDKKYFYSWTITYGHGHMLRRYTEVRGEIVTISDIRRGRAKLKRF